MQALESFVCAGYKVPFQVIQSGIAVLSCASSKLTHSDIVVLPIDPFEGTPGPSQNSIGRQGNASARSHLPASSAFIGLPVFVVCVCYLFVIVSFFPCCLVLCPVRLVY